MNRLIHILHLEDDPIDAELVQARIEAAGLKCRFTCVQTREEFEAALHRCEYDVILADFRLPMYDGMSALRQAQELCPDIPFIFVSGMMGEEAVIEGLTEGATDYVLKQSLSRLTSAIPRALDEAENRRERRRAEEELHKLSRAVEQSANTIIITDTEGYIEYANPRFSETTGYTLAEAKGSSSWTLKSGYMPPEEHQRLWKTITAGREWHGEFHNTKKSGEFYWESVSISPIKATDGTITHYLVVKEDITERKQAEAELKKHRDHLEELVKERTAELSIAREKAETANQAKSEFLTNMSHELRTPLNSILGFAQILQRQTTDQETSKRLGMIRQSGEHLLTLLNDILDISKIEARRLELYPQPFHLPPFLDAIVHIIRERALRKGLLLVYEADETLPAVVQADETRLRQVLLNLLGNAVKFTDTGQVELLVKRLDMPADAAHANPQALLRFEVSDTGVGMTPEQVKKAFQPFEQVGDVSRRSEGTGLGLAISHQLVQLMKGKIHVESEPGQGSRFWFEVALPLTELVWSTTAASERTIIGYKGPQRKVLIVDDIDSNRTMLIDMLAPLGFKMLEAENGRQALKLVQNHRPDLILMDRRMPVMDGLTTTRRLRQLPGLQETLIISVSASVSGEAQADILAAGCNAFLPKPVNWPDLAALLETHLQLEWEFEDMDEEHRQILGKAEEMMDEAIVLPLREDLEALHELVRVGSMAGIKRWATELAAQDAQYKPLADQLYQLAGEFEVDQLIQLAQQYLAQTAE